MEAEDEEEIEDVVHPEYDEHVWLSLKNAEKICFTIADKLSEISGKTYSAESYIEELESLHS